MKKVLLTIFLFFLFSGHVVFAQDMPYIPQEHTVEGEPPSMDSGMPKWKNPLDSLNVPLPTGFMNTSNGIICDPGDKPGTYGNCRVPFIAEYIAGWFKYLVGIGGLLGVMACMVGGFMWIISAGNAQKIGEAKNLITNSLIGIVLLATSYIILHQVNPELTQLKSISVGYINKVDNSEGDSGASTEIVSSSLADNINIGSPNCSNSNNQNLADAKTAMTYMDTKNCGKKRGPNNCTVYVKSVLSAMRKLGNVPASNMAGDWLSSASPITNINSLKPGDVIVYSYTNADGSRCGAASGHAFMCYNAGCSQSFNNGSIINTPSFRLAQSPTPNSYAGCTRSASRVISMH